MNSYIFETIEQEKHFPSKVFVASIETSSFHWHYEYELMLILKGSLIVNVSPETVILHAGDIILFNSKRVHGLKKTTEDNLCLIVQLDQSLFENGRDKQQNYYFYLNSGRQELKPKISYQCFIRLMAQIGLEADGNDIIHVYRVKALLYTLAANFFEYVQYDIRQYSSKMKNSKMENPEVLIQVIEYVEENFLKENLEQTLYKKIGMCEKTLYRFLKEHTGLTLKELIVNYKIEHSKVLLKHTKKPIACITAECGFSSENTFYRTFKKDTGLTPKEYRLNGLLNEDNPEIKGYINFSKKESIELLKKYACIADNQNNIL